MYIHPYRHICVDIHADISWLCLTHSWNAPIEMVSSSTDMSMPTSIPISEQVAIGLPASDEWRERREKQAYTRDKDLELK